MNKQDYEKAKAECWENFKFGRRPLNTDKKVFDYIFDRAYALGREKEAISQEEIEKAALDYIRTNPFVNSRTATTARESFVDGANFALGKQEKNAEKLSSLEEEIHAYAKMCSFTEADYIAIRKAVEHGISLITTNTSGTAISGWVARDEDGNLFMYQTKPGRNETILIWMGGCVNFDLRNHLFPDLTWDDDPIEVELIIKRKNK